MTKKIPLTRGKFALVDDADYKWLNKWKWTYHIKGYAYRQVNNSQESQTILMHRLILNPSEGKMVDHINRDGLDNQRHNLREATNSQNLHNTGMWRHNTTGHKGVKRIRNGRFVARIQINGETFYGNGVKTIEEAAKEYDKMAKEMLGDFSGVEDGE